MCCCGECLKTRTHILQDCPQYDDWRPLLLDSEGVINITDLFGTDAGSERTSKFIDLSGVYEKKPTE
jgi:hypothetical protein